jgi:hypothetical protein
MNTQALSRIGLPLWYALLAPPAVWGLQGLLGWFVEEHACHGRSAAWLSQHALGAQLGIGVCALAAALLALVCAARAWRRSGENSLLAIRAGAPSDYLAALALLSSVAFLLAIVLALLPPLLLPACEVVR